MKVFVFAAFLAVAAARPQVLAPMMHHDHHHGHEATAGILEHDFQMMDPGQYVYKFKTENGIEMMEQAALAREAGQAVQGVFSYVAPNGEKVAVRYVADESGFHPEGDHIPKMPVAIARALEWIAAHPDPEARKWDQN